jgi:hypothetical protein
LLKVLLRKMTLTTKRSFHQYLEKTLRIIIALVAYYGLDLHQMNVKTTPLIENLEK